MLDGLPSGAAGTLVGQRVAQPDQEVIERLGPRDLASALDFGNDRVDQHSPAGSSRRRLIRVDSWQQMGAGITECQTGRTYQRREVWDLVGRIACLDRLCDQQIGGDLGNERARVVDEDGVRIGDCGRAECPQHLLSKPVDRGDGGTVELGDRGANPAEPLGPIGAPHAAQERFLGDLVTGQRIGELHQPGADTILELSSGGSRERDDQHFADGDGFFGDVAGSERGQRVGLPRAGTCLDRESAVGNVLVEVERFEGAHCSAPEGSAGVATAASNASHR